MESLYAKHISVATLINFRVLNETVLEATMGVEERGKNAIRGKEKEKT